MAEQPQNPGSPTKIETILSADANDQALRLDYRSLGTTGLRQSGGIVNESTMRGLTGRRAAEVFKDMGDNDPSLGIIEFMIRNIVRSVKWPVREASEEERDVEAADFVRSCMDDMDVPWDDVIDENLSMIRYGWSLHEIVYKRRAGRSPEPWLNSKYQDGRVGWRGMPIRSQDTLERWSFDEAGALTGFVQMDPYAARTVEIPNNKMLLFRTRTYKNNPEGESAFRRAYRPWFFKKHIEETEAIGIQRDLAGLPLIGMPPEVMAKGAGGLRTPLYNDFKDIVTKVRRDELEGVLMPLAYDENGKEMFKFELMSSGGARQFDTSKIIERLDTTIFRTALADFLMLGTGTASGGSYAMHSDKSAIFLLSLKAYLNQIKNVYNLHAIPRLLELNGMSVSEYPQIDYTPLEQVDMTALAGAISQLSTAGMPLFPNPDIERRILEVLGLPVPTDTDRQKRVADNMPTRTANADDKLQETHPDTPLETPKAPEPPPNTTKPANIFRSMPRVETPQRLGGRK